ncbi:MAG TPA: hypothetical protein PLG17_01010, partial [Thermodesulfobacteriota bacterium]|nr:hypothetical protein [Thermodesulfobacteriota bacterium]
MNAKRPPSLLEKYYRVRFVILFFSLLACIGAAPILCNLDVRFQSAVIILFLSLNLLVALISITGKRVFHLLLGIGVLICMVWGLRAAFPYDPLLAASNAAGPGDLRLQHTLYFSFV